MKFVLETGQNILIHGYEVGNVSITGVTAEHSDVKSGLIDEWDNAATIGNARMVLWINGLLNINLNFSQNIF